MSSGARRKSDERLPGDGDFVEEVLSRAREGLGRKHALAAKGYGFERLLERVSSLTDVPIHAIAGPGKETQSVRARSLLCFLAVKELGLSLIDVAPRLGISVPTVSVAVQRAGRLRCVKRWRSRDT